MRLSKRLAAVMELVQRNTVVCDVGTDHGYVAIDLVKRGVCSRAIAMDVRPLPLQRAEENIRREGLSEYIQVRLSDGLSELRTGEANGIVIAGMGGALTVRILRNHINLVRSMDYLVLQPQSELSVLRSYLRKNELWIDKEDMIIEDGKFYPMMRVLLPGNASVHQMLSEDIVNKLKVSEDKAIEMENEFGPFLLYEGKEELKKYLVFWENLQKELQYKLNKSIHEKRFLEIKSELERIRMAKEYMGE